jgi:hypothetical protein
MRAASTAMRDSVAVSGLVPNVSRVIGPLTCGDSMPILVFPPTKRKEVIQCLSPSAVTSLGSPARLLSLASGRPSPGPASYEGWDATGAIPSRLFVLGAAIPRCAIAHRRFALARALSDKRYALAPGMTRPEGRLPDGQISALRRQTDLPLSSASRKNISVLQKQKSVLYSHRPVPLEGRFAIVTSAGRDAVDADGALRRGRLRRTEKACGPDTPTLVSSLREVAQATVAKKPGAPGRARSNP